MPAKYIIESSPAPPRFPPVGKFTTVELRGNCLGCRLCVKDRCVYQVYLNEIKQRRENKNAGDIQYTCSNCLMCVQECRSGLIERMVNPAYLKLGDSYYTPEIITRIWNMAENGKIPVSGAGYGGPFTGPGFDSMWTDFSEIVRPTRDGIHGREYISTAVELGRKPRLLSFDANGNLTETFRLPVELPLPILLKTSKEIPLQPPALAACIKAAEKVGTMMMIDPAEIEGIPGLCESLLISNINSNGSEKFFHFDGSSRVIELPSFKDFTRIRERLTDLNSDIAVMVRLPDSEEAKEEAVRCAGEGIDILHIAADAKGECKGDNGTVFILDRTREIHLALVEANCRDEITLIASGGIAMAEHMAKTIIVGADLVAIDLPLNTALECRLCRNCIMGRACPVKMDSLDINWGTQRIVNLLSAWHGQLIEILGAMGLREVRRLRGEVGRAMFFEELERETFGKIFAG